MNDNSNNNKNVTQETQQPINKNETQITNKNANTEEERQRSSRELLRPESSKEIQQRLNTAKVDLINATTRKRQNEHINFIARKRNRIHRPPNLQVYRRRCRDLLQNGYNPRQASRIVATELGDMSLMQYDVHNSDSKILIHGINMQQTRVCQSNSGTVLSTVTNIRSKVVTTTNYNRLNSNGTQLVANNNVNIQAPAAAPTQNRQHEQTNSTRDTDLVQKIAVLSTDYPKRKLKRFEHEKIENTLVQKMTEGGWYAKLKFNGILYRSGVIIVTCIGTSSSRWLADIVPKLNVINGVKLCTCQENEIPKSHLISIVFPKSATMQEKDLLALLHVQNDALNINNWNVHECETIEIDMNHQKRLILEIDQDSMITIQKQNCQLHFRFDQIKIEILPATTTSNENEIAVIVANEDCDCDSVIIVEDPIPIINIIDDDSSSSSDTVQNKDNVDNQQTTKLNTTIISEMSIETVTEVTEHITALASEKTNDLNKELPNSVLNSNENSIEIPATNKETITDDDIINSITNLEEYSTDMFSEEASNVCEEFTNMEKDDDEDDAIKHTEVANEIIDDINVI